MTFRPPAKKQQQRRRSRQTGVRRSLYLNIAFGVATLAAVALLAGVLLGNYYADHWAPVASVNGSAISKDAVRDRAAVNKARYEQQMQDYEILRNRSSIASDEYSTLVSTLSSKVDPSSLYQEALSQLEQDQVVAQYAAKNNISISDADVDAQITKDATLEEMRRVKIIAVDAQPTPPANLATQAQIDAAKAEAEKYLSELKSGKSFDDVYKEATADGIVGAEGTNSGDVGLVTREQLNVDPGLVDQIFSLGENEYTAVFDSEDGLFRVATVTKIVPAYTDSGWADAVGRNSSGDAYRGAARAEALKQAVQKSIEAKYITGPTLERQVQEIAVSPGYGGSGPEYKMRIMIFAPNHDVTSAATLNSDDPAWADAKKRADEAYAQLQQDPSKFAEMAKDTTNNDDQMFADLGGDVPWISGDVIYDYGQGGTTINMPALRLAVEDPTTKPGILQPIQEPSMGWVIVDYQGSRPSPATRVATAQLLISLGKLSFGQAVAEYSEAADAVKGGNMGWISRYQLSTEMEEAIFSTPVGSVSRTISSSSGFWIFKVLAEETRVPDAADQAKLKRSLFSAWLSQQMSQANIWQDLTALTAITPAST